MLYSSAKGSLIERLESQLGLEITKKVRNYFTTFVEHGNPIGLVPYFREFHFHHVELHTMPIDRLQLPKQNRADSDQGNQSQQNAVPDRTGRPVHI